MTTDLQTTAASLLALPPRDRLLLGETLIESVEAFVDDDINQSWREEIERRVDEIKSGTVKGIPLDEALVEVDRRLAARKAASS